MKYDFTQTSSVSSSAHCQCDTEAPKHILVFIIFEARAHEAHDLKEHTISYKNLTHFPKTALSERCVCLDFVKIQKTLQKVPDNVRQHW